MWKKRLVVPTKPISSRKDSDNTHLHSKDEYVIFLWIRLLLCRYDEKIFRCRQRRVSKKINLGDVKLLSFYNRHIEWYLPQNFHDYTYFRCLKKVNGQEVTDGNELDDSWFVFLVPGYNPPGATGIQRIIKW